MEEKDREILETENEEMNTEKKSLGREILEWIACIVIALVITLLLRNFVFTMVRVDGSSMDPTLANGERLVMIRLGYEPKAGDIVVVDPDNGSSAPYIKRIIGMPGDLIQFETDASGRVDVYINGELQEEAYISSDLYPGNVGQETYTVPEGHVFVMGDNRPNSKDSRDRSVGFIPFDHVLGEAAFRLWPLNRIGTP